MVNVINNGYIILLVNIYVSKKNTNIISVKVV